MLYRTLAISMMALALATPAAAEDSGNLTYQQAWFDAFHPATAYDMVVRVPGFQFAEGEDRRGFSGTAGNVLIDGAHPNSKSESLADQLKRIPARQVARIEVRRDADTGAGGLGQTLLVNVVRTPVAAGGVWSLGAEYANAGQPAPNGYAAVSGRFHRTDYSFGANLYSFRRRLPGHRTLTDGDGQNLGSVIDDSPRAYVQYAANGELAHDAWSGRLTGRLGLSHSLYADRSQSLDYGVAGQLTGRAANPYSEGKDAVEAGLSFDRPLLGGELKLAALAARKGFDSAIVSTSTAPDGAPWARYSQTIHQDASEDIVRTTYTHNLGRHRAEFGGEAAVNSLDARAEVSLDLGAGPVPLHIPNANIRIIEHRAEVHAGDVWTPHPGWSLESRLAWETSRLHFTGDTVSRVELHYLKPSIQLSRDLGRHQLRLRMARDIGQLDFTDFTSAAAFADNRINGGNPGLRPPATWRSELTFDGRFGKETTLTLRLFHDAVSDANDLVPITRDGVTYDAPGNVGEATVDGLQLMTHLPLQPVIAGGRFDLDGTWRTSHVTDPLTGEHRPLSDLAANTITAAFRQDIPKTRYAWGVSYKAVSATRQYYVTEINRHSDAPSLDAFIEARLGKSLKLQITARSLLDPTETRRRTFYATPRPAPVDRVEDRTHRPGDWLYVTLSGWF